MSAPITLGRRKFLGCGTAAATALAAAMVPGLGGAAALGVSGTAEATARSKDIGDLTHADFSGRVGQRFAVNAPEQRVPLTLIKTGSCSGNAACVAAHQGRAEPFSLLFTAPAGSLFESGTYQFSHPEMGRMKLFVSSVGMVSPGRRVHYEVVFG